MRLLGLDLGTTHCKGAIFDREGTMLDSVSLPTPTRTLPNRQAEHDPERLLLVTIDIIRRLSSNSGSEDIAAIGVASMAEAGCLVDGRTGRPRTPILPWFDTRSAPQAERIAAAGNHEALFARTGLYPSFKHGLAKLLWLRDLSPHVVRGGVWLSVADWIVFRLTGHMVTDPTLAARTYLFNLLRGSWDQDTVREFKLSTTGLPEIRPSGAPVGGVTAEAAGATGLVQGTPVAVSGHDHVCTLLAAGVVEPGAALDSMGTAESLIGVLAELHIGPRELESGLSFVPHMLPGSYCWLGGISSSGGSVEWLRAQLGLTGPYDEVVRLLEHAGPEPTGILYFPYLAGSGAPRPDQSVRAAFIGLSAEDDRGALLKAVVEGVCFEAEVMRRAAEKLTGSALRELALVGGGAKNPSWVQIKADVFGCDCHVPALPEATALGAALAAGLGSRALSGVEEVARIADRTRAEGLVAHPDARRHQVYRRQIEDGYLALQEPLRAYRRKRAGSMDSVR